MNKTLASADRLIQEGKYKKAYKLLAKALKDEPENPDLNFLTGKALLMQNQTDDALPLLLKAVACEQAQPCWHVICGAALEQKGFFAEAENSYRLSELLGCTDRGMYYQLGHFYASIKPDYEKSELYFAYLIKNYPQDYYAYIELSELYMKQRRYEEAIQALDHCLVNGYENASVYINLGKALCHQGRQQDALSCNMKAIELDPNNSLARRNAIIQSLFAIDMQADLYQEIMRLTSIFNTGPEIRYTGTIDCTPGRKLKIGFVSADLRMHAINHYFLQIYQHFDKSKFSLHIYYNYQKKDHYTKEYYSMADSWCDCIPLSDEQLAQKIRSDKIDILIDLSHHTLGNRLEVFQQKPAPMQVSLMGAPVTTGMKCMDYSVKDSSLIESCDLEKYSTEAILPMDNTAYYHPLCELPPLADPPCIKNGFITFGSFNGLRKIDVNIFKTWAKLLSIVPDSRFHIVIDDDKNLLMRDYIYEQFTNFGVDKSRIILQPRMNPDEYFASHNLVDIALDPYPYHGETTTYNSLLMGLPIVSRVGNTEVSNTAKRILTAINKQEWLAKDFDEYIEIAVNLAKDTNKLIALRKTLRSEIENSSIMDYEGAARRIESALLSGWEETCKKYGQQKN